MTDETIVTQADLRLWCLHHIGPDEVHPAPDFVTAQQWADWANVCFGEHADISRFVVAVWPWSAERHADGLAQSIAEWTLPERQERRAIYIKWSGDSNSIRKWDWKPFDGAERFSRHRIAHSRPSQAADVGEQRLKAHFARMMEAAANYVEPTNYIARHPDTGNFGTCKWNTEFPEPNDHQSESVKAETKARRDQAFIRDMIYMLDGPEQRKALATLTAPPTSGEEMRLRTINHEIRDDLIASAPETVTFEDLIAWLTTVRDFGWTWTANTRCKYVDIRIDTRRGAFAILDRDGNKITLDELRHQHRAALTKGAE